MSQASFQRDFGARLRALRMERGLSQEMFAARAGLDRSGYGKLERGDNNVTLAVLARIAVALDVSMSLLLEGVELDGDEVRALPKSKRGPSPLGGRRTSA